MKSSNNKIIPGKKSSLRPMRNTTSHSSPLDLCMVVRVTLLACEFTIKLGLNFNFVYFSLLSEICATKGMYS